MTESRRTLIISDECSSTSGPNRQDTISINLEHILKYRHLPGRAAGTLGTLLSVLVVCSFGLAPGQSNRTLGVEILATGAVVGTQAIWVSVGKRREGDPLSWTLGNLPILLFPPLAFVGGGCSLLAGSGGGLYWVLPAPY
jgi:hypothetical protein